MQTSDLYVCKDNTTPEIKNNSMVVIFLTEKQYKREYTLMFFLWIKSEILTLNSNTLQFIKMASSVSSLYVSCFAVFSSELLSSN